MPPPKHERYEFSVVFYLTEGEKLKQAEDAFADCAEVPEAACAASEHLARRMILKRYLDQRKFVKRIDLNAMEA